VNDDIQEWTEKDEQQELTDNDIIALLNRDDSKDDEGNDAGTGLGLDKMERMSHSKGVKALEAALAYFEQQGETTATGVTLLRYLHDPTARTKLGNKLQSLTHLLSKNICILPYCTLNVAFN
jgi:hypothetical protein